MISFVVTAKLICIFVFAYVDLWVSHEVAQMLESVSCASLDDKSFYVYLGKHIDHVRNFEIKRNIVVACELNEEVMKCPLQSILC